MKKLGTGLLAMLMLLTVTACGAPGDEPATQWCDMLDKHAALIKDGKFNKENFEEDAKPIMEELKKHKNDDGKIPMTTDVLKRWKETNASFADTCEKEKNIDAMLAYSKLASEFGVGEKGNAPAE